MRNRFKRGEKPRATFGSGVPGISKFSKIPFIIPFARMALDAHVVQLHQYLKRLIKRIKQINILVEIDKLLKTSQAVASSSVGQTTFFHHDWCLQFHFCFLTWIWLVDGVGAIFESYLYLACTEKERKSFRAHYDAKTKMPEQQKTKLLKRYSMPFAFFVASLALSRSGGRNNKPMFYLTLLNDYHGLSNRGAEVHAAYHLGLPRKAYTRIKARAFDKYARATTKAVSQGQAVGVADNYNQKYWIARVDAAQQGLQNRNRSVGAVSVLPKSLASLSGNRNLQSLPKLAQLESFLNQALKHVENALESAITPDTEASDWKFFDAAEVTQQNIHCVPLKMPQEEIKRRELPPHDIGLTHFRPLWILDHDPASNRGCYQLFHRLFSAFWPSFENGHYFAFRFDINIYNMFWRVLFSFSFLSGRATGIDRTHVRSGTPFFITTSAHWRKIHVRFRMKQDNESIFEIKKGERSLNLKQKNLALLELFFSRVESLFSSGFQVHEKCATKENSNQIHNESLVCLSHESLFKIPVPDWVSRVSKAQCLRKALQKILFIEQSFFHHESVFLFWLLFDL